MKISEIIGALNAETVNVPDERLEIFEGYASDFLSNALVKAPRGSVWFTVMNNINVAAVAYKAGVSLVVLCEGVAPDSALRDAVFEHDIALITTELPVFEACKITKL